MPAFFLYRALTGTLAPGVDFYLRKRIRTGKEDPLRVSERRGIASLPRPPGPLIWVHAASVGEAVSALPLIEALLKRFSKLHVLVTTGTVTSARILEGRLPERAFHQFVPADVPFWVRRFLDYWKPDAALWIESEIWPNLVHETARRGISMALVNGRISQRTFRNWQRVPGFAASLLSKFAVTLAQTVEEAGRLRALGASNAGYIGNLKYSVSPLPADETELAALSRRFGKRPVWISASTHEGEEEITAAAHRRIRQEFPDLLTVLVPRHPSRADAIADALSSSGLKISRRSKGDALPPETDIFLCDTMGELGLFYRLCPIAFIGGSFSRRGGHNPIEAARLGCAVIFGPDMSNFETVARDLLNAGGAIKIEKPESLAREVINLLRDDQTRYKISTAGRETAEASASVVNRILDRLLPMLPRTVTDRDGATS